MQSRKFGRTGREVSEVGFGSWAIGAAWGTVDDDDSLAALHNALDRGVNFIDTADVYGDGRSETARRQGAEGARRRATVHRHQGRPRLPKQTVEGYTPQNLTSSSTAACKTWAPTRSTCCSCTARRTTSTIGPKCSAARQLVERGKLRHYGVSVESRRRGAQGDGLSDVVSVQIIFNMFRHRPAELFFDLAKRRRVGILARVPLASGLLTGKFKRDTQFEDDRPPPIQPPRRSVRRRRNLFGRGL